MIRSNDSPRHLCDTPDVILRPFTVDVWDNDQELVSFRSHFTNEMRKIWERAINSFDLGDWNDSKENLQLILEMTHGKDGPAKQLLRKIAHCNIAESQE